MKFEDSIVYLVHEGRLLWGFAFAPYNYTDVDYMYKVTYIDQNGYVQTKDFKESDLSLNLLSLLYKLWKDTMTHMFKYRNWRVIELMKEKSGIKAEHYEKH